MAVLDISLKCLEKTDFGGILNLDRKCYDGWWEMEVYFILRNSRGVGDLKIIQKWKSPKRWVLYINSVD